MTNCPLCDIYYDDQNGRYVACSECWDGIMDGGDESRDYAQVRRLLTMLAVARDTEEEGELKIVADSAAFMGLCERALPLVERGCLVNLLRKVQQAIA